MRIILEIENLKHLEVLLPLFKYLQINIVEEKPTTSEKIVAPNEPSKANLEGKKTKTSSKPDILKFAGIISEEEAKVFESAIIESRKIDYNEW